jgi:hypothetical protein
MKEFVITNLGGENSSSLTTYFHLDEVVCPSNYLLAIRYWDKFFGKAYGSSYSRIDRTG